LLLTKWNLPILIVDDQALVGNDVFFPEYTKIKKSKKKKSLTGYLQKK